MTFLYSKFFQTTLTELGFDVHGVWNAFDSLYDHHHGWPLKLPDVEFGPRTLLVMHFQDFVTIQDDQVVELDRVAQHYGKHANQVLVTHMHPNLEKFYTGPVNLIEFSNHNHREISRLREQWHEWKHILEQPRTQAWQCLNGRTCSHRRRVADILSQWNNGVLSYGTDIPLPEWDYSTYRGTENNENFIRLGSVYGTCAVNIVTETLYDPVPGLFCEKTLFAMLAEQIPIVIGSQGLIASLRAHGFDMFDDVVDISYDSLPNETRLNQALELNRDVIQGQIDLAPYRQRLQDQRAFVLDDYTNLMELRFIRDCKQLSNRLNLQ
jgi:hypothetical protein